MLLVLTVWLYSRRARKPQDQQEKVLVTVGESDIKNLDPAQTSSVYAAREVSKVYEGLLEFHYLKRPCELVPNLAAELPQISADGLVYTFQIRPGIKFQDNPCFKGGKGRELVAEDFVYSIKRVADSKVQSTCFSMLADKIQGLDAWRDKYADAAQADYTETVEGLKATDRYTLQFKLNHPWPQFLYILAQQCCYAVPREAVEHYGQEFLNHPVGTGPFTLEAFNPQLNKLVYHKNPTFRDKYFPNEASEAYQHMLSYAGKKLPLVDKVITHILTEEQPRWLMFQQGKVDILDIARGSIAKEIVQDSALSPQLQEKGIQLFLEAEQACSFYVINSGHELFNNNVKLRRALSLAFDRQRYNELFYKGKAKLAQSIVPPGLAGYQKDYINPYNEYNLAKAKQLLKEAGYPDGQGLPVITLDITANTHIKQMGEFFQKCMKKLGINIKVVPNIFPELCRKVHQKETMIHIMGWGADYPDAEAFLQLLYKSDQIQGIGANFSNANYNTIYEKATAMQPCAERTALYEQLNRIAAEEVPIIYVAHMFHTVLYHGWVKNYLWTNFHYEQEQYIDVDLERKRELQAKY